MGRAAAGLFALWGIPFYIGVLGFAGYLTLTGSAGLFDNGDYLMTTLMLATIPAGWFATKMLPWVRKYDLARLLLTPVLWLIFAFALSAALNLS